MGWEDKWNEFKDEGVDEIKLDTPELIRKYAGVPGSSRKHSGYNTPGTDPEFIWKNLPKDLKRIDSWNWKMFCQIRDKGVGSGRSPSAKEHELPGGFWFSTIGEKSYDFSESKGQPGTMTVRLLFSKDILDPKKTYWDGESGDNETGLEQNGPWDTKHLTEFWYDGTIRLQDCQVIIVSPKKHKGQELQLNCTEEQFKALAFPEVKIPEDCPICGQPLTDWDKRIFYYRRMCQNCWNRKW